DLRRVHVATADGEHVDPAVAQIQETVLVEIAEIAERIPPVAGLGRRTDVAVGRRVARCGTHVDLADLAGRAFTALIVEHLHLAHDHGSDRPAVRQPLVAGDERARLLFGTGVQLPDGLGAQQLDPGLFDRRRATARRDARTPVSTTD